MGNGDDSGNAGQIVLTQDGNYSFPDGWRDALPEDLRQEASLQTVSDLPGLVKQYVNAQKMIGRDKIPIPGEGAGPEEWADVYKRLGRPDTADEYGLQLPASLPPGAEASEELMKEFAAKSHEAGLLPHQVRALYDWYNAKLGAEVENLNAVKQEKLDKAKQALKDEWKGAYDEQLQLANRAFDAFAGEKPEDVEDLKALVGNDPRFIRMMAKIGKAMSEDKLKGAASSVYTPADAQTELTRIMNDRNHPYFRKDAIGHAAAVAHVAKLNAAIYGDDEVRKGFDIKVTG